MSTAREFPPLYPKKPVCRETLLTSALLGVTFVTCLSLNDIADDTMIWCEFSCLYSFPSKRRVPRVIRTYTARFLTRFPIGHASSASEHASEGAAAEQSPAVSQLSSFLRSDGLDANSMSVSAQSGASFVRFGRRAICSSLY